MTPMDHSAITLDPSAAARVVTIAQKQNKPAILRLSVEGGGCSGFQYRFNLVDGKENDDHISEIAGASLVIDPVSAELLGGAVVTFVETIGGSSFQVQNPNAAAGCGCGSSFAV